MLRFIEARVLNESVRSANDTMNEILTRNAANAHGASISLISSRSWVDSALNVAIGLVCE